MMKKTILTAILLVVLAAAYSQEIPSSISELGCYHTDNYTIYCPMPGYSFDTEVEFVDNIGCFSDNITKCVGNCSDQLNLGCYSGVKLLEDINITLCEKKFTNETVEVTNCTERTIKKGTIIIVELYAGDVDLSNCKQTLTNHSILFLECPYLGKKAKLDLMTYDGDFFIGFFSEQQPKDYTLIIIAFIIILAIIGIAAYYFIKKPKKKKRKRK